MVVRFIEGKLPCQFGNPSPNILKLVSVNHKTNSSLKTIQGKEFGEQVAVGYRERESLHLAGPPGSFMQIADRVNSKRLPDS